MNIRFHRKFQKALRKQPSRIQRELFEKLNVFSRDPFHYSLNNHALKGEFEGWRSFNITGDVRVHYEEDETVVVLMDIGTHSQLYD